MKRILSVLLVCGMLCAALLSVTGCSEQLPYEKVYDMISNCDVDAVGGSVNILKTDFAIKNWIKENATDAKSMRGIEESFSKYIEEMTDEQKKTFGLKCQAILDAEWKLDATSEDEVDHVKAWGVDVQTYDEDNLAGINEFFSVLDGQLTKAQLKPATVDNYSPTQLNAEAETNFDRAYFLDIISSIAQTPIGTSETAHQRDIDTASLMDFVVENAKAKDEEVQAGVEECYRLLSVTDRLCFDWNFTAVLKNVSNYKDYPEGLAELGISVNLNKFSDKKLDKLVNIISSVSGVNYTVIDPALAELQALQAEQAAAAEAESAA